MKKRKIERRWKAAKNIAVAVGNLNSLARNSLKKRQASETLEQSDTVSRNNNKVIPDAVGDLDQQCADAKKADLYTTDSVEYDQPIVEELC